jgi:hypothetical protein
MIQNTPPTRRMPGLKNIGIAIVAIALGAVALYAALREVRTTGAPVPVAGEMGHADRPALTADEERFAHELWKIHDKVRTLAVRMSFVGLSYKMGDITSSELPARVGPILREFRAALSDSEALVPPASLKSLHGEYVGAVRDYEQAAVEMIRAGKDKTDERLINAQTRSAASATMLLKVSEALWPGEHKPN